MKFRYTLRDWAYCNVIVGLAIFVWALWPHRRQPSLTPDEIFSGEVAEVKDVTVQRWKDADYGWLRSEVIRNMGEHYDVDEAWLRLFQLRLMSEYHGAASQRRKEIKREFSAIRKCLQISRAERRTLGSLKRMRDAIDQGLIRGYTSTFTKRNGQVKDILQHHDRAEYATYVTPITGSRPQFAWSFASRRSERAWDRWYDSLKPEYIDQHPGLPKFGGTAGWQRRKRERNARAVNAAARGDQY